jgi:DNA-binding MarR family transcriptional regulator
MAPLIDCLAKGGYVEREKSSSDTRGRFVVLTDSGHRLSKDATFVLCASLRRYFYRKRRTSTKETRDKALMLEARLRRSSGGRRRDPPPQYGSVG